MKTIIEPAKEIPVVQEVDICVLGGSCTGVFAAVRAARLGARVAIVEKQNSFGGTATNGMVNIWHSLLDSRFEKQIIAGLTQEVIDRLKRVDAVIEVHKSPSKAFILNTEELKIELDFLIKESGVTPYLHTYFCQPYLSDNLLKGVFIENKSGRSVILARYFIDATGDGDLCYQLNLPSYKGQNLQPPTTCARLYGLSKFCNFDIQKAILEHGSEFGLEEDWGWRGIFPQIPEISFHAETHVFNVDCSDAADLTYSEMEGRRHIRAIMDIIRKYGPKEGKIALAGLPSTIGIRETRHFYSEYRLTQEDLLYGKKHEDAIACGTYRVDIHQSDRPGIVFRYLDGTEVYSRTGYPDEVGRWRSDGEPYPAYYQVPYRALIPKNAKYKNLLMAGRMIDADEGAYGAVRVMVNMNQIGEAAGVAAFLALNNNQGVDEIDASALRKEMARGGSIL